MDEQGSETTLTLTTNAAETDRSAPLERYAFEPRSFDELLRAAELAFKSCLIPKSIRSAPAAMVIGWQGRELGLTTMQAWRSINVIDGLPSLSAQLMHALVLKSGQCELFEVAKTTPKRCTVRAKRKGDGSVLTVTWTLERAKHLLNKRNWQNDPQAMLRNRAISEAARARFPHVVLGLHTPEELADGRPDGELEAPARDAASSPPPAAAGGLKAKLQSMRAAAASSQAEAGTDAG